MEGTDEFTFPWANPILMGSEQTTRTNVIEVRVA